MNKTTKDILYSILVGACVAFLSTLFEGLATFLKSHATEVAAGVTSTVAHIVRRMS